MGIFAEEFKPKLMKKLFTIFALVFTAVLYAQTGSIVGNVTDKEINGEPLPFASVVVKGTQKGTTTDFDGNFTIENIPVGTYTIEFSFVGYETVNVPNVNIIENKFTTINSSLGASAAALDEVVISVSTSRARAEALLVEQRKATTITTAIGAQELARKGVSDAAGAVAQISGVSRQEGSSNVYVRGLGDRYLNTTYNGLNLPSNDIEKKNINLDIFSSDIIEAVSVSKAYSSNFYGDFAAGNVDIQSKDYSGDGFLDVSLASGVNTNAIGQNQFLKQDGFSYGGFYNRYDNNAFAVVLSQPVDAVDAGTPVNLSGSFATGDSFRYGAGDASKVSYFATASFGNNFEYRQGRAADITISEADANSLFPDSEEFEYSTNTTAMANVTWRPDADNKVSFNSLFINNSSSTLGRFGISGNGVNRNAFLDDDAGFYQQNSQIEQDIIYVNQLLSKHKINEKFELNIGLGYNTVFARQPDRKRFSIEQYYNLLDTDESTTASFYNNVPFDNQRYFQNITDKEYTGRIDLTYTISDNATIIAGYNGRTKSRDFSNIRYGYDFIDPNTPVNDVNNLDAIFDVSNLGQLWNTEVFRPIAPEFGVNSTNRPGLPENTYSGDLDIHGIYASSELITDKWTFVPGIRFETFDQSVEYANVTNLPPNDPGFRSAYENFLLPSLSIKYALNDRQNLRFATSRTVSVPEFKEVAPFVYINIGSRVGGNPDILSEPAFSEILNLDLKYEWFIGKSDFFSVAAFAKQINDPINLIVANDATGTQRFARTGDKAEVLGAEVELRKTVLKDADDRGIVAFGLNATIMSTKQDLKSSEGFITTTFDRDSDQLQGASPFLLNADLSWTPKFGTYEPTANLVFSYFSDRIDALGSGQLGNIVEKSVSTLDFVLKNEIGDHWEVNASAGNILNPTIEYVRETSLGDVNVNSTNGTDLANYKRGVNLGLQLKYKF